MTEMVELIESRHLKVVFAPLLRTVDSIRRDNIIIINEGMDDTTKCECLRQWIMALLY